MNEVVIKVIGNYSYQTSRCLGEGVYGKVYEGVEKETKQKVAIKKIDLNTFTNDKYLENAIFSEIYLLKRFNHPNIVKFKDVLSSKNSLYIITEFCKNGDLKEVLKKKRFKEEEAFEVIKQILNGFNQLVRERIIHRDLKPANILINEGVYKIGDFGFAKYVDNFGSQMLKSCVGSPIYMAPQILERTPYTTKCDIWSIGVIFYEMIHNSPPWKARDETELLRSIKTVSISQILRKSSLTNRAVQFLKKTLAFSEQQRISWSQLFQLYGARAERAQMHAQSAQKIKQSSTREKNRVVSGSSSSNSHLTTQYGLGGNSTSTNIHTHSNSISSINSPAMSPERKRNFFPPTGSNGSTLYSNSQNYHSNLISNKSQSTSDKKINQVEAIVKWHHFLVFYHFYCVQLFVNFPIIVSQQPTKPESYGRLLMCLSQLIKNRNTFGLSMISNHTKTNKAAQQLYKAMKYEHESYELMYNDIVIGLEKQGMYKNLKGQLTSAVGHSQVINEERMDKMEYYLMESAQENIKNLGEHLKSRDKDRKNRSKQPNPQLLQTLDSLLELHNLVSSRTKTNKSLEQILDETPSSDNNTTGSHGFISYDTGYKRKVSEDFKESDGFMAFTGWSELTTKDPYMRGIIGKYERHLGEVGVTPLTSNFSSVV